MPMLVWYKQKGTLSYSSIYNMGQLNNYWLYKQISREINKGKVVFSDNQH